MKKIILITLAIFPVGVASAQEAPTVSTSSLAPTVSNTTPATAADVDALRQQVFAEVVQNQRVVLRVAQKRSDPLERFEETGEIFVSVFLADARFGEDDAVAMCQRANGRRLDRSFEVKV